MIKKHSQIVRSVVIVLLSLLGVATLYALRTEEAPRFVLFLGRFHPLLLHLPIGALIITFFIDVTGRFQESYPSLTIKSMLGFTAFFTVFTCFLGYFLSLEGGYQKETLDLHLYTGIGTAILSSVLFYVSLKTSFRTNKVFFPLFIVTLISVSVAGHFGSVLTHGDQFLTEYARAPEKEKTIEVIDSLRLYPNVIAKIFDDKCIQCHNTSKRKGELSLISKAHMLAGGESGDALIKGNAAGSLLYSQLLLPITHKDHMPPEGKAQLTKDEIWLIKHWIDQGLDFESYVTNTRENDSLSNRLEAYLVFDKVEIPRASKSDMEAVRAVGYRVLEIVPGEGALDVKYLQKAPDKEAIDVLAALKEQIVALDFNTAVVTDPMTAVFKKFKNLKTLRLNSPEITDAALANFKNLKQLEVLNIYNTRITSNGLSELLNNITPKQIYSWQTQVDEATAKQLAADFGINIQNNIKEGFVEISQLETPDVLPANTLFTDDIYLSIESRLKNVDLRYTLNGETPTTDSPVFSDSIHLSSSKTLKIAAFKEGWLPSEILVREYAKITHDVTDFSIKKHPDERYSDATKLFDLEEGSTTFSDGNWIGYFGDDLDVTIDLGEVNTVDHISFSTLEDEGSWILFPTDFIVYTSNTKNGSYKKLGEVAISRQGEVGSDPEIKKVTIALPETTMGRYFRIHIKNHKALPEWHPAAGNPVWLFVDEIYFW